jgi:two-component system capsular synthesis response regulator RcsB
MRTSECHHAKCRLAAKVDVSMRRDGELARARWEGQRMRIVICDDHPVVLIGLRAALAEQAGQMQVVGEASGGRELLELLAKIECDLLITDFSMDDGLPDNDGMPLFRRLQTEHPSLPVIVLTMVLNPAIMQGMLATGVRGVVDKMAMGRELMLAIQAVMAGRLFLSENVKRLLAGARLEQRRKRTLSPRETEVVRLLVRGVSVTEIARLTGRSVRTVSQQKRDAMRKLGLDSDKQLHDYAHEAGLA